MKLPGLGRLDGWTIALAFALAVGTLLVVILPQLSLVLVDQRLDLVINTAATLAALSVSALSWARYREAGQISALYPASAFAVLGLANGLWLLAVLLHLDVPAGIALSAAGELPIYVQGISRLLAAGLLTAGALATPPAWLRGLSARTVMLAPIALVLLVTVIGFVFADRLPPLLGDRALALLRESGALHPKLPGPGLALLLLDTAIGGLYLAAALLYLRVARGPGGRVVRLPGDRADGRGLQPAPPRHSPRHVYLPCDERGHPAHRLLRHPARRPWGRAPSGYPRAAPG